MPSINQKRDLKALFNNVFTFKESELYGPTSMLSVSLNE